MRADIYAEWLRRQGHRIIRTESSYWYDAGPRVLQAFPYHWLIRPSVQELRHLTVGKGNIAVRYSSPVDAPEGMISYHVVLRTPYKLEMLRPQARNAVCRGLEQCRVERISLERLAKEGWILQRDTLERQGRLRSMTRAMWERSCLSAVDLPGFDAWGAIVGGELAATLLATRIEDTYCVPCAQANSKYLKMHVNNALFYAASCELLAREGVRGIFFSLHSLDAPESVNEFKFRMGLMAKPVRQIITLHPLARPLANRFVERSLSKWVAHHPGDRFGAKAEGMLRFYLQGQLPLGEQCWPRCLSECKAKVLGHEVAESGSRESGVRVLMEVEGSP